MTITRIGSSAFLMDVWSGEECSNHEDGEEFGFIKQYGKYLKEDVKCNNYIKLKVNWLRTDKKRWKFISGYLKRVFDRFTSKEKYLKNAKICGNKTGQFRQFYCRVVR